MALTRSLRACFAVLILACRDLPVGHTAETAYGRCNVAQCKGLYFGGSAAAAMLSVLHTDRWSFHPETSPPCTISLVSTKFHTPKRHNLPCLAIGRVFFLKLVCEIPRLDEFSTVG